MMVPYLIISILLIFGVAGLIFILNEDYGSGWSFIVFGIFIVGMTIQLILLYYASAELRQSEEESEKR